MCGPRLAVLFVGLFFIIFHLTLLQGISITLLALALGIVYTCTRLLPASIFTHVGANFLASLMLTSGIFLHSADKLFSSVPALIGGLILAAVCLLLIDRAVYRFQKTGWGGCSFYSIHLERQVRQQQPQGAPTVTHVTCSEMVNTPAGRFFRLPAGTERARRGLAG